MYYLLVKRAGKQFRRSLKTKDLALAKRNLRTFQDNASQLSTDNDLRNIRFGELADRWLATRKPHLKDSSFDRLKVSLKAILEHLGNLTLRSIGQTQLEKWKSAPRTISARTWNIESETLKQIFRYAKNDLKLLIDDPTEKHKVKQKEIVIPTKEHFRSVVDEVRSGHRSTGEAADFMEFLGYSGCRKQEASTVRLSDVDMVKNTVRVTGGEIGTKNHESRTIPLFTPLRRLVESIQSRKPELEQNDLLFNVLSARMQIRRACERLKLPLFTHHTMRHFFCSNAIEAGVDFKTIAEWLGHKDGGVLVAKTYGHLRAEHSHAMAQRITFDAHSTNQPN